MNDDKKILEGIYSKLTIEEKIFIAERVGNVMKIIDDKLTDQENSCYACKYCKMEACYDRKDDYIF